MFSNQILTLFFFCCYGRLRTVAMVVDPLLSAYQRERTRAREGITVRGISVFEMPAVTACNSQETCEVLVTHENLQLGGDPCPEKSYSKYLFVSFTCISECILLDLKYPGCRKMTLSDIIPAVNLGE